MLPEAIDATDCRNPDRVTVKGLYTITVGLSCCWPTLHFCLRHLLSVPISCHQSVIAVWPVSMAVWPDSMPVLTLRDAVAHTLHGS